MAKEHQDYEKRIVHHLLRQAKEQMKQIQDNIDQEKGKQSNAVSAETRWETLIPEFNIFNIQWCVHSINLLYC
jgi:hypothetical protein